MAFVAGLEARMERAVGGGSMAEVAVAVRGEAAAAAMAVVVVTDEGCVQRFW